jgi:hypothetical protein
VAEEILLEIIPSNVEEVQVEYVEKESLAVVVLSEK